MTEPPTCASCGAPVEGMRFCTACGTPVRAGTPPPVAGAPEPLTPIPPSSTPPPTAPPTASPTASTAPEPITATPARGTRVPGPAAAVPPPPTTPPPAASLPATSQTSRPGPRRGNRNSRNNLVLWALVGVVLVLVVGGGAFALGSIANSKDKAAPAAPKRVSAPTTRTGGADESPSDEGTPSQRPRPAGPGKGVAGSLSRLISDSTRDKTAVSAAVAYLDSCRKVETSVRTLDRAAQSRGDLVTRAKRIDDKGVAGAGDVVSDLVAAWQKSAQADSAFADFGRSLHRNGKGKCVGNKAWRDRGVAYSAQSHPPKQAAAKAWNRLARKYGFDTIEWPQL